VKVFDGLGGVAKVTVNVDVQSVNDVPAISGLRITANEGASLGNPEDDDDPVITLFASNVSVSDADTDDFPGGAPAADESVTYAWTLERKDAQGDVQTYNYDTGATAQLDGVDVQGEGETFLRNDRVTVVVTANDGVAESTATRSVTLGSPPWFPLVPLPDGGTVQVVLVLVEFGDGITVPEAWAEDVAPGDTVLTARADGEFLQPEDYMSGSGPGKNGLLPGTYKPYFRVWDQAAKALGAETVGEQFGVTYDEPDCPTDLAGTAIDPPLNRSWDFRFNINLAQGFVLEMEIWREQPATARAPADFELLNVVTRDFSRPALDEPFPVTWEDTQPFVRTFPELGTYWWRVGAFNPLGTCWADGSEFTGGGPCDEPPPAPDSSRFRPVSGTVVHANDDTDTASVGFSWDPVAGATGYYIFIGTLTGNKTIRNEYVTEPSFAADLAPGDLFWTVKSVNECGRSDWASPSVLLTVLPAGGKPGLVQGVAATGEDPTNSVTFTWTWDGVEGTGVDLPVVNANTQKTLIYEDLDPRPSPEAVTFTTGIVDSGVTYYFKARGVNAQGVGPWSGWGKYTMPGGLDAVTVAPGVVAIGVGQVTFSWILGNAPADAKVRLQVMNGADYGFAVTDLPGTSPSEPLANIQRPNGTLFSLVKAGVTYHFRLLPLDSASRPVEGGVWSAWAQYTMPTR